jgi:Ankyrin repeats (3 copies)
MSDARVSVPIYFAGKVREPVWKPIDELIWTTAMFLHYINTVWVNQDAAPTKAAALAKFDVDSLLPEYRAFIQGGGRIPERGASLEEYWLGTQLSMRCPITCLLNAAQPKQEVARITRLRRLSAVEIWAELQHVYANPALKRPLLAVAAGLNPLPTLVYDGDEIAHIITVWTIDEDELHFSDSWPGRSLLCPEHNGAGVAARESKLIQAGWQITRTEFERVVFAVYLHTLADPPPRPVVELTEEERQAAEQQTMLLDALRRVNRSGARPIEGMQTISRLEFAARFNRVWEVKVAINEGDDLNERGKDGATALHIAASAGHLEIVKLLAEHGADRHARNAEGQTPAEAATVKGNTAVAEYFESLK